MKTAILVVNLGTPEAPTEQAVREYLAEFLSDRRVVSLPRWLWMPILHGVILRRRPARSAALYKSIWGGAGSPLLSLTRCVAAELGERFAPEGISVAVGMRYGKPSLARTLETLVAGGATRVVVLGLYPQNAFATTASLGDALEDAWVGLSGGAPEIPIVPPWGARREYIEALADSIEAATAAVPPEVLAVSFHGIPRAQVRAGDVYQEQCEETFRLLDAELKARAFTPRVVLCWQSRFGPAPWLEPYAAELVPRLAREGVASIAVATPGFPCDCLETLEEIAVQLRDDFLSAGGKVYTRVPCLNAATAHIDLLEALVREQMRDAPCAAEASPSPAPTRKKE